MTATVPDADTLARIARTMGDELIEIMELDAGTALSVVGDVLRVTLPRALAVTPHIWMANLDGRHYDVRLQFDVSGDR